MKTGELYHSLPESGKVIVSVGEYGVFDVYKVAVVTGTEHGDSVLELYRNDPDSGPIGSEEIRLALHDMYPEGDAQICVLDAGNGFSGTYFDISKVKVRATDNRTMIYFGSFRCG